MAMPLNVLAELPPVTWSLASLKLAPNKLVTLTPLIVAASSRMALSVTASLPATTVGASLAGLTMKSVVDIVDLASDGSLVCKCNCKVPLKSCALV